jgi:hypothetical protein
MNKVIIKKLISPLAIIFAIVSCKSISGEPNVENSTLEPLYGIDISVDTVSFNVKSFGCTHAEDFVLILDSDAGESGETGISILRTKRDLCRRMPKVIEIDLAIDALKIAPESQIKLKNPLVARTH